MALEGAPASATALLRDSGLINLPGTYVVEADFDNERRIGDIQCPLFMMHGKLDDVAPFDWHASLIWDKTKEPRENLWIENAGHSDIPEVLGNRFHQEVISFISRYVID